VRASRSFAISFAVAGCLAWAVGAAPARAAAPVAGFSTGTLSVPQITASVPAFTIPKKGKCTQAQVTWTKIASGRGRVELDVVDENDTPAAMLIVGLGDARRVPKMPLTICKKDEPDMGITAIKAGKTYRLKLVYQASRKSPEVTAYAPLVSQG